MGIGTDYHKVMIKLNVIDIQRTYMIYAILYILGKDIQMYFLRSVFSLQYYVTCTFSSGVISFLFALFTNLNNFLFKTYHHITIKLNIGLFWIKFRDADSRLLLWKTLRKVWGHYASSLMRVCSVTSTFVHNTVGLLFCKNY